MQVGPNDRGHVTEETTIGACWDAYRLDLTRLGRKPQPELLLRVAGKKRAPRPG
jgi:uncharacterized protein